MKKKSSLYLNFKNYLKLYIPKIIINKYNKLEITIILYDSLLSIGTFS